MSVPDSNRKVSQGGEGVLRRVTEAEQRRHLIALLQAGRGDLDRQRGWDLAMEVTEAERDAARAEVERLTHALDTNARAYAAEIEQVGTALEAHRREVERLRDRLAEAVVDHEMHADVERLREALTKIERVAAEQRRDADLRVSQIHGIAAGVL